MTTAAQDPTSLNNLALIGQTAASHGSTSSTSSTSSPPTSSRARLWTGRISIGLGLAFMTFDCVCKLLTFAPVMESSAKAGFNPDLIFPIGVIELVCIVPYAVARTRALGAVLLSGYFGGAVATHLHLGHPLFSQTLFPLYIAAVFWLGAFLTVPNLGRVLFGAGAR